MFKVLKNSWALFTGLAFMMIAHGLQGTLLGVRATYENFNLIEIAQVSSGTVLVHTPVTNQDLPKSLEIC